MCGYRQPSAVAWSDSGKRRRTAACWLIQEMSFCKVEMMILWTASFNINVGGKILIPMQHLVHIEIRGSGGRVWHEWVESLLDGLGWGQTCAVAPLHSRLGQWVEERFSAMSNKSNTLRGRKTSNSQWKLHIKKIFNLCRGCRSRWELWWLLYACN